MTHVLVRHKVNDYGIWKQAFDNFLEARQAGGETSYQIYHAAEDSNDIVLVFGWDSLEHAKAFMASDQLREAMGAAGVAEPPYIHFLEGIERGDT